jgi:hypothetical protein
MIVEKTATVTEDQRVTVDRVQRVLDEENFELMRGEFLCQYEDGRIKGCACGALSVEYGASIPVDSFPNFNKELARITEIPYFYLEGLSDGFEGSSFVMGTRYTPEDKANYELGAMDGRAIRRELM